MYIILVILLIVSLLALVIGLFRPGMFKKLLRKKTTRKNVYSLFGTLVALLFFGSSLAVPPDILGGQEAEKNILAQEGPFEVVKVIDGDTFDVQTEDSVERVRPIGIDTPETVDPRKPVGCFGQEASRRAKELLDGQAVFLLKDKAVDDQDKYGRLLRYIRFADGTSFNKKMIEEGFAYEYTYDKPYAYQAEFKNAEFDARENERGLWSPQARCQ